MPKKPQPIRLNNKTLFSTAAIYLRGAAKRIDFSHKFTIAACLQLAEHFEKLEKDYKIVKKS